MRASLFLRSAASSLPTMEVRWTTKGATNLLLKVHLPPSKELVVDIEAGEVLQSLRSRNERFR